MNSNTNRASRHLAESPVQNNQHFRLFIYEFLNLLIYALCIRRNEDTVIVKFADQVVKAVPYDMAVIGYGTDNINTLRLWEAEALNDFDFLQFNDSHYDAAVQDKNDAENITKVLYPNDNQYAGCFFFCKIKWIN